MKRKHGEHLKLAEYRAASNRAAWRTMPTKAIRVPEEFADALLKIARRLDNQTLSIELLEEAIDEKTAEIKAAVIAEVKRLNSL